MPKRIAMSPLLSALLFAQGIFLLFAKPMAAIYFSQSDLTLRIPYDYKNGTQLTPEINLIHLRTLKNDSTTPKKISYKVLSSKENIAMIDWKNENILLNTMPKNARSSTILVQAKEENGSEAILEIKIVPKQVNNNRVNCTDYMQDMCFWNISKYRIYENQPASLLGTFGPPTSVYKSICPQYMITDYELLNGTDAFYQKENEIYSNESLDRDSVKPPKGVGPRQSVKVRCIIWEETTGVQYTLEKILNIDILDQNDNPPKSQTDGEIVVHLNDFTKGDRLDEKDLIIKDADDFLTNSYSISILEDHYNVMNLTYEILEIDHHRAPPPSTAIIVGLYAKTTLLPKSPYRVMLQVRDESLLRGFGNNTLNLTVTFFGPEHHTTTTENSPPVILSQISYPASVEVSRSASLYHRLVQPVQRLGSTNIRFELKGPDAFDVTNHTGIVYVAEASALRSLESDISIRIVWRYLKQENFATISIKIFKSSDSCKRTQFNTNSCAMARKPGDCEKRCGIATGSSNSSEENGGGCSWRWNKSNYSTMTRNFETCSPDLTFCPDNECDELEDLDERICPQDCSTEKVHFGEVNRKTSRGIFRGVGACFCEELMRCQCGQAVRKTQSATSGKEARETNKIKKEREKLLPQVIEGTVANANLTGVRTVLTTDCGITCVIGIIVASLFVLIIIVGSFILWRYRIVSKGRRGSDQANGIEILHQDYTERGDGLLIGLNTLVAANGTRLAQDNPSFDSKWEFPRYRLKIEQVLGEGEFGRVLRAKATDIAGELGSRTVAVKTLKSDACASELADLLSEYQLLKEVQHPNVIKLLGACTTSGGPIYLIIEFAEHGSLRNYLRNFRHLESEGRLPCSTSLLLSFPSTSKEQEQFSEAPVKHAITARDIISFAWQISKGMAYLAEIKLVHRDLAARNVLLASGKVCKISDFGLTRDVYEDDAYLKRSKGRVPVKWMALESLVDNVYTSKSDVWSFGVLLWELVTLGSSPYPGINVHNLYSLLKDGYRMEKPANCSHELYKLMSSCWNEEPGMRPTFKELTHTWERMLEESIDYLDLNPRTVHNQAYFESLHTLDSPCSSTDSKKTVSIVSTNNQSSRINEVNYLNKPFFEAITKADKVNKLDALWKEPLTSNFSDSKENSADFKETSGYVNDSVHHQHESRYETPIKRRNISETSNAENELDKASTSNVRPQSYVEMQPSVSAKDSDNLLMSFSNGKVVMNNFGV